MSCLICVRSLISILSLDHILPPYLGMWLMDAWCTRLFPHLTFVPPILLLLDPASHQQEGPQWSCSRFLPVKSMFFLCHRCSLGVGFYKAPTDNLDCNRCCFNKVELFDCWTITNQADVFLLCLQPFPPPSFILSVFVDSHFGCNHVNLCYGVINPKMMWCSCRRLSGSVCS